MSNIKTLAIPAAAMREYLSGTLKILKRAKKDNMPTLSAVHLHLEDGLLTLTSTDRYRLHIAEFPVTGEVGGEWHDCLLSLDAVMMITRSYTKTDAERAGLASLEFAFNDEGALRLLGVSMDDRGVTIDAGAMYEADYPKVHRILESAERCNMNLRAGFAMNLEFMADMKAIAPMDIALFRFVDQDGKMMLAEWQHDTQIGEVRVKLLMAGTRSDEETAWTREAWQAHTESKWDTNPD